MEKESSWIIRPLGIISAIFLFPSHCLLGLVTPSHERALLDFQETLLNEKSGKINKNNSSKLVEKFHELKKYQYRLDKMKKLLNLIETKSTSTSTFLSASSQQNEHNQQNQQNQNQQSQHEIIYAHKQSFNDAILKELFIRNPLKYSSEFPLSIFYCRVFVGVCTFLYTFRNTLPALKKTAQSKSIGHFIDNLKPTTSFFVQDVFSAIKRRVDLVRVVVRYRREMAGLLFAMNGLNIVYWGVEILS